MRLIHIGILLSVISIAVSAYFLFFTRQEGGGIIGNVTTTTTSEAAGVGRGKVFTPVTIKEPAGKNEISIYSDRFEPSQLTISLGEEVNWTNKDSKDHVIVLSNPPLEKTVLAGTSFVFQFSSKGTVEVSDKDTGARLSITIS